MKRLRSIAINLMNVAADFLSVSFGQQLSWPLTSWPRAHAGCLVACPFWVSFEWMGVRYGALASFRQLERMTAFQPPSAAARLNRIRESAVMSERSKHRTQR